jgi:hypothetical protein
MAGRASSTSMERRLGQPAIVAQRPVEVQAVPDCQRDGRLCNNLRVR